MANMKKKLSLQEAVDYLQQLNEEDNAFGDLVDGIYIEPPDEHGNISGEDDADENEGGTIDDLNGNQLRAGCELVLRNGQHIDTIQPGDQLIPTENVEDVLINILEESQLNLSVDQPTQEIQQKQIGASSADETIEEEKGENCMLPIATRLRKINPILVDVPIPPPNKGTTFKWSDDVTSAGIPMFPEANFDDCRDVQAHELFERFFDDELLEHINHCSALYAIKKEGKPIQKCSIREMRTFIGILMVTGYNSIPSYKAYWNSSDDLRNELIYRSMRRGRFEEILSCLHFEPNLAAPDGNKDKLWKLRPMTDHLKANMLKHFHPTQHLSYDESMIAYYGRHGCKQFIKGKPIRFGFKAWSLCTPSGYMVNFEIYQGKNPRSNPKYEERFGKCSAPLLSMIDDFPENIKDLPFFFYFDNLFTGFPLLTYMKARGYNATGTIRENRIPPSCPLEHKNKLKKLSRGTYKSIKMSETGIILTNWVDNSVVCIASTCFGATPTSTASRYSRENGRKVGIVRPCAITEYNKYMCGVDRLDQNVNNHRVSYRGKKWWSSIFTWFIDVAVNNAGQLQRGLKPLSQLEFKRSIAVYYCTHYGEVPIQPGPKRKRLEDDLTEHIRYDRTDHFVGPLAKRRRCAGDNCKSVMSTCCIKCNIGLCVKCFQHFHTPNK